MKDNRNDKNKPNKDIDKKKKKEKEIDEGLRETFPASDPPATHQITGK